MIVIFDLDGTVWDSERGIVAGLVHAFDALGLEPPPPARLTSAIGPPLRQMLEDLGVPDDRLDDGVAAYRERYLSTGVFEAELYPGVVEALDDLRSDGHRLATATSKGEAPTVVMLAHFGITDRFEVIGAASMDGAATTKVEVLARTLAALGDPEPVRCRMVGDRHYDVTGAARFGIPCIGAAWGYGGEDELRRAGAASVAATPSELRSLLR